MNDQLSSIVFFFAVFGLTFNEKKRLNNLYTPFTVTAWPFVVITLLVNFVLHEIGFTKVTVRVNYFILMNLLCIWAVGFIFYYFKKPALANKIESKEGIFSEFYRYRYIIIAISFFIAITTFNRVTALVTKHGGWWYVGTDEFGKEILEGITAHLIMFAKICFVFLSAIFIKNKKNILYYLTLVLLASAVFIAQNKYHLMMILLIVFFMGNLEKNVKQQIFQIVKISIFLISLFFLYFIVVAIGWKTKAFGTLRLWDYFFKMFLNYLVSGPIVLDQWLNFPNIKPDWTMFMPFIDLWNFLIGSPKRIFQVTYLSKGFFETLSGFHSNVGTSFGVYYMIGGMPFTIFMTSLVSIVSYYFYFKHLIAPDPVKIFFNSLFLSLGVLSFFVQYFTLMSMYEMCFSYLFIISIFKILNRYKYYNPRFS